MSGNLVLDSGPLGLWLQRPDEPGAAAAQQWLAGHLARRTTVVVPEIADYEVRRELVRLKKHKALRRLDEFIAQLPGRYLPITTDAMREAARLWADVRGRGLPTADPKALDGDVILAAQVRTSNLKWSDTVVATTNVVHLSRFTRAELRSAI